MMKNITRRQLAFAATLMLALSSLSFAAPAGKHITISGRVLKVDKAARTLLVSDQRTKRLYLVSVREGATFKVTFGQSMQMSQSEFRDANRNDRVRILCERYDKEHLSRLADGSEAIVLTVAQ
jgi:type 1 fimbria pilin